jgi:small GTP-binding protein
MLYESDDEDEEEIITIKVILLGETGVGKTNLKNAVTGEKFQGNSPSTITPMFIKKDMVFYDQKYKLKLWDTAGQEKFRALNKIYYKDSKVVLLIYDITNKASFNALEQYWLGEIKTSLGSEPVMGLVGNKSDLEEKREVDDKIAEQFAKDNDLRFKLCSGKEDPKSFNLFLRSLVKEYLQKTYKNFGEGIKVNKYEGKEHGSCIIF